MDAHTLENLEFIENSEYEILDGNNVFREFDGLFIGESNSILHLHFSNNTHIKCTYGHVFEINEKMVLASTLKVGDYVTDSISITKITQLNSFVEVFDLANIHHSHNYLSNNIIHHNCLFLDEFAFLSPKLAIEFVKSVFPVISSAKKVDSAQIIIVSTPNGMNHYYKIFNDAETGKNGFIPFRVIWNDVPGRNEEFKQRMIADVGELAFRQEFECVEGNTTVTIQDVLTGEIKEVSIREAYHLMYGDKE